MLATLSVLQNRPGRMGMKVQATACTFLLQHIFTSAHFYFSTLAAIWGCDLVFHWLTLYSQLIHSLNKYKEECYADV
ncbi:hypothetical protein [Franconibacter helveticus]|uniref:hypothetical protein n=1 Tax=Franconibacter helveticus TaxID=357240 RepID=UPI0013A67DD4|nr:hypothetical protein [Franconibacter helveticus]